MDLREFIFWEGKDLKMCFHGACRKYPELNHKEMETEQLSQSLGHSLLLPVGFICTGKAQRLICCTYEFGRMRGTDGGLLKAHSS